MDLAAEFMKRGDCSNQDTFPLQYTLLISMTLVVELNGTGLIYGIQFSLFWILADLKNV